MNIFKLAFELFIIYLVYKLIFDFIIPVYNTTKHMKQKMNEMHQQMQDRQEMQDQSFSKQNARQAEPSKKSISDDYIEFEEIK